ncbi:unnamed protein product [Sphagnum balticum]
MQEIESESYLCWGSMDPLVVRRAFQYFFPLWQKVDQEESDRLQEARENVGCSFTSDALARKIQFGWPVDARNVDEAEVTSFLLSTGALSLDEVNSFLRFAENLVLEESLAPIIVYWSENTASKILPAGARFRQLMREAACVSFFSQELTGPKDDGFCFLIEGSSLCLVIANKELIDDPPEASSQILRRRSPNPPDEAGNTRTESL